MTRIRDEKAAVKLTRQLTGPLLTDPRRIAENANRDPDEPPIPDWWTGDDDNSGARAATQLGRVPS